MPQLLIRNGRVIDPASGLDAPADVLVEDGRIAAVRAGISAPGAERFDAKGKIVAPGIIDTPAAAYILSDPDLRTQMGAMAPLRGSYPGPPEAMAALLAWCVSPENSLMTGQVMFADAGFDCQVRGEKSW